MATFGILVGGGPAPGINGVIGAATLRARAQGARVIGCLNGFHWLMQGDTSHVKELQREDVELIHLQGGSILHTSRANPTKEPGNLESVVRSLDTLGIDHLITIGGDDTAYSSRRVGEAASGKVSVVHVPKTIDNDLPLPEGIPTFGYETAREFGAQVVSAIGEDCTTTGRWFFIIMMGRQAGFLALGAGKSAGAAITLIPEEFPARPLRLDDLVRTLEGAIVKRLAEGRPDGVAVIAEGVAEHLDENDLDMLKDVARDEHGHIRLAEVPLGRILRTAVAESLAKRGIEVKFGDKDVGYELRCMPPTSFDRDYTRDLGVGAVNTLLAGTSSVLITRQSGGIVPIPFQELMDPKTGRTRVRGVNLDSDSYRSARALQDRVETADLEDPKRLAALAEAARLSPEETKTRYAPIG